MDCIVTIPKRVNLRDWMGEVQQVEENPEMTLNFRVAFKPNVQKGDRCYVVHDGEVIGYHIVDGVKTLDGFKCETTGKFWKKGTYIIRKGRFYPLKQKVELKGFRGVRYKPEEVTDW